MRFSGKVGSEQMVKFWWQSGSTSGYRDCFPDSSLLGDTESGINRQRCTTLQCRACTSRHRHSNDDVITSPAHDRQPRQPVMVNDMATLVRHALAEVCTVPVLLFVNNFASSYCGVTLTSAADVVLDCRCICGICESALYKCTK